MAELSRQQAEKFLAVYKPAPVRPSAREIFDAMTTEEQDATYGPAAAEAIRKGEATLADFVEHTRPGGAAPGFIRQRPVEDI